MGIILGYQTIQVNTTAILIVILYPYMLKKVWGKISHML